MNFSKVEVKFVCFQSHSDGNVKILLFGDCVKKFWKLQIGTAIALVAPPFADSNDKQGNMFFLSISIFAILVQSLWFSHIQCTNTYCIIKHDVQ